jgi:CYTH domain-containing protein
MSWCSPLVMRGRFDHQVGVDRPHATDRVRILEESKSLTQKKSSTAFRFQDFEKSLPAQHLFTKTSGFKQGS